MEEDYWAWYFAENPTAEIQEDDDFRLENVLRDIEENPDGWETVE